MKIVGNNTMEKRIIDLELSYLVLIACGHYEFFIVFLKFEFHQYLDILFVTKPYYGAKHQSTVNDDELYNFQVISIIEQSSSLTINYLQFIKKCLKQQ